MTRKELLSLAANLHAENITTIHKRIENIYCIACSYGTYGRNAMLLTNEDRTKFFVITCRTTNIFLYS